MHRSIVLTSILFLILFNLTSDINAQEVKDKNFIWGVWYNAYKQPPLKMKMEHDQPILNSHLEAFKKLGITRVYFLVKFPTGEVFYKSKIAPIYRNLDWDPFAFIVKRCHELGLEIYPYVNVFPEGEYNEKTKREDFIGPYLMKYPDRAMIDSSGNSLGWVSPAIPSVVEYELSIIEEIVNNYRSIDGIQLDRLRYPCPDAGYETESIKKYRLVYKKDPVEGDPDWIQYRQELMTDFLRKAKERIKKISPGLPLSAAVFPRPDSAKVKELQNWPKWCHDGILDEVVPMTYAKDFDNYKKYLGQELSAYGKKCPFLTGIGAFFIPTQEILKSQIKFALSQSIEGIVFFNGYDVIEPSIHEVINAEINKK